MSKSLTGRPSGHRGATIPGGANADLTPLAPVGEHRSLGHHRTIRLCRFFWPLLVRYSPSQVLISARVRTLTVLASYFGSQWFRQGKTFCRRGYHCYRIRYCFLVSRASETDETALRWWQRCGGPSAKVDRELTQFLIHHYRGYAAGIFAPRSWSAGECSRERLRPSERRPRFDTKLILLTCRSLFRRCHPRTHEDCDCPLGFRRRSRVAQVRSHFAGLARSFPRTDS